MPAAATAAAWAACTKKPWPLVVGRWQNRKAPRSGAFFVVSKVCFCHSWPNGHVGRSLVDSSVVEHAKTVPEATGSSRAKDGVVRFLGYALAVEWREQ